MIAEERLRAMTPTAGSRADATASDRGWTPLRAVLVVLPIAAVSELLLIRTFYRVGVYIPKTGPFRDVYAVLTAVGSFGLNLSSVLVVVALGLLAARGLRGEGRRAGFAVAGFLAASVLVRLAGVETVGPTARLTFALAVLAVAAPFLRRGSAPRGRGSALHRAMVAGVAGCFLLSTYSGLAAESGRLAGASPGGGVGAQLLAEALVVVTGLLALAAWARTDGFRFGPAVIAAPLAAALMAAWWANGAITGILVLWTVGLRLYLPVGIYAVALWAMLAAAIGWLPRYGWRSAGLVLLLVAGLLLGSTYLQSLGLLALVLLTDGVALGGLPERRPARV